MPGVITFSPELSKFNNSGRFGSAVQIVSVVLKRIDAVNNILGHSRKEMVNCNVGFRHKTIRYGITDSNVLSVEIEGRLEIVQGDEIKERGKNLLAAIITVYELRYALPKEPIPKEMEGWIRDFADINGIYNAWPYFRSRLQDITSDMGIPLTLPTFRIIPKKTPEFTEAKEIPKLKSRKRALK